MMKAEQDIRAAQVQASLAEPPWDGNTLPFPSLSEAHETFSPKLSLFRCPGDSKLVISFFTA